jgi:hypothetical protein
MGGGYRKHRVNAYKIVGNSQGKRPPGRPKRRQQDNIEQNIEK